MFIFLASHVQAADELTFLKNEAKWLYANNPQIAELIEERQFIFAYIAYRIHGKTKSVLLIDYDKPSLEERAYAISMDTLEVVQTSVVSHGRNTGQLYAKNFSNINGSKQTSLGVFLMGDHRHKYFPKGTKLNYPNALVMKGMSGELNDQAVNRAIIAHQAWYVKPMGGRLGRSEGCPAFPLGEEGKAMLEFVRNGGIIMSYSNTLDITDIL